MESALVSSWGMLMSLNASIVLRVNSEKAGQCVISGG